MVKSPTLVEVAEASSILARVILKCTESDNKVGSFGVGNRASVPQNPPEPILCGLVALYRANRCTQN